MRTVTPRENAVPAAKDQRRSRFLAFWAPIVLLESYLGLTVFLFYLGPVEWDRPHPWTLLAFLVVNYSGLAFGYGWGIAKGRDILRKSCGAKFGVIRMSPRLPQLLMFSMLFTVANAVIRLVIIRGSLSEAFSAFLDPGAAYREAQILAQLDRDGLMTASAAQSWLFRFTTVFQVFNGLYFSIAIACWRQLSKSLRALFFLALSSSIVFTVGIGAQSGIGQLLFGSLPVAIYVLYVDRGQRPDRQRLRRSAGGPSRLRTIRAKLLLVGAAAALVATVASFQVSRARDSGQELDATSVLVGSFGKPSSRGIIPVTGGSVNYGLIAIVQYVSHGYEGLAMAMELPFVPTYGLGWSRGLQRIFRDYLGAPDVFDRTYPARNEAQSGWPAVFWWSTIFPWIASDTTFYGTVCFIILVGYVIGRCWSATILTGNPLGFALLAQLFTLVFMFPANNALAQTLDGLLSFAGVVVLYAVSRKYYRPGRRARAPEPA